MALEIPVVLVARRGRALPLAGALFAFGSFLWQSLPNFVPVGGSHLEEKKVLSVWAQGKNPPQRILFSNPSSVFMVEG